MTSVLLLAAAVPMASTPYGPAVMAAVAAFEIYFAVHLRQSMAWFAALFILAFLGLYLHATLRGKFVVWAQVLDKLKLRGRTNPRHGLAAAERSAAGSTAPDDGPGVGRGPVAQRRSVGNSGRGHPAARRPGGRGGSGRMHTAEHDGPALEDSSFDVVLSSLAIPQHQGNPVVRKGKRTCGCCGPAVGCDRRHSRHARHELHLRRSG